MPKLSREIVKVIVAGEAFHGEFTSEIMVAMQVRGLTTRQIASIFGISQQAIIHRLNNYRRFFPERNYDVNKIEIRNAKIKRLYAVDGLSIRHIADELEMKPKSVVYWLYKIFPNGLKRTVIDMTQRHERLCRILFGVQYEPSYNFLDFILREIEKFEYDQKIITEYYISGNDDKESFERLRELHRWQKVLSARYQTATLIKEHVIAEKTSTN